MALRQLVPRPAVEDPAAPLLLCAAPLLEEERLPSQRRHRLRVLARKAIDQREHLAFQLVHVFS